MKITKFLFAILFLGGTWKSFAQNNSIGEKIYFPSPQAAQLGKYGGYKVNHSNGLPNVSIPLYTAKEGDLSIPISLAYNYSGYRPTQEPGWAGLGFSLVAGGSITRTIKSTADEIVTGQMAKIKTFVDGSTPVLANYQALSLHGNNYPESEPDIFSFQFDGLSGKFVIDENGVARVISDQKIKFTPFKSAYGPENKQVITKWVVVSEVGTTYTFDAFEVSFQDENATYIFPSAWYLTDVVNVKGDKVAYEYSAKDNTKRRVQMGIMDQWTNTEGGKESITKNYTLEIYLQKITGSLWEIVFNSDPYTVTSTAGPNSYARKLTNFQVKTLSPSVVVKQFDFNYKDVASNKLALTSVGETGTPPYSFQYYSTIPETVHGSTRQVDAWGYYNGWVNPSLVPNLQGVDLNPRINQTKIGALTTITYPTGGTTSFEYQQNEYSYVRTTETSKAKTNIENYDYFFRNIAGVKTEHPNNTITLTETTRVDIRFAAASTSPTNCTNLNGSGFQTFQLPAGSYSGNALLKMSQYTPCNLIFGPCADPGDPCGFFPPDGYDVALTVKVFRVSEVGKPYYGGIRVSKMTDTPGSPGSVPTITNFTYAAEDNSALSSGVILQEPIYDLEITYTAANESTKTKRIVRSNPFNPIAMGGLYYKDVKENNGLNETLYTFTSFSDQNDIEGKWACHYDVDNSFGAAFGPLSYLSFGEFQMYDFMRGLPKKILVKEVANGNIKQQTDIVYAGYNNSVSFNNETFKVASFYHELLDSFTYATESGSGTLDYYYGKAYYIVGGWPRKTSETVTTYGSNNADPVTVTTNYEYGTNHLQLKKQSVTQSNGLVKETSFTYPLDYSSATGNSVIQAMIAANMVSYPIEQVTKLGTKEVAASLTTYGSFSGNANKGTLYLPYKQFKFNGSNNSVPTNFGYYNGTSNDVASTGGNTNSYYEVARYVAYNKFGNPISLLLNNSDKISYVWAYKGQYPVAEIQNADNTQVSGALGTSFDVMADETNSSTILTKINGLKAGLTSALVTGYLYQPLVGMTQKIAPNGLSTYYTYDALERLEKIKDNNNQTVKSYKYNYVTP